MKSSYGQYLYSICCFHNNYAFMVQGNRIHRGIKKVTACFVRVFVFCIGLRRVEAHIDRVKCFSY